MRSRDLTLFGGAPVRAHLPGGRRMRFSNAKTKRRNWIFTIVVATLTILLALVPTKFHDNSLPNTIQARARVQKVNNDDINQFGLVKEGTQTADVEILNGPFKGEVLPANNMLMARMDIDKLFAPGDLALVGIDLADNREDIVSVNMIDHYRIHLELILFILFCVLLLGFAGWTGLKALISFMFTGIAIWKVYLPVVLLGWNPVFVSLGLVTILSAVIIFLVGGLQQKGVVAFFGAFSGVVFTCLLSLAFGSGFKIHGAVKPFSETLLYSGYAHLDLTQIFLAGVFMASAGAVMDIAMDVSASMKEVKDNNPNISTKKLIRSGFNVGRAVIGTMTTTLLLAYSGGYTTMLMVFLAQGTPIVNIFNITFVSSEILQTLVGSFGLVLVAPSTAIIAGFVYARAGTQQAEAVRPPGRVLKTPGFPATPATGVSTTD